MEYSFPPSWLTLTKILKIFKTIYITNALPSPLVDFDNLSELSRRILQVQGVNYSHTFDLKLFVTFVLAVHMLAHATHMHLLVLSRHLH